ncbi:MAG: hypothetical protein ACJA1A_002499 [Saprospiraceae bacterium]|jgi:hypothetical protein
MGRIIITIWASIVCVGVYGQLGSAEDMPAFIYKLDYNVPESPAFSVLGANPTSVMRGSASQEVVVNLASEFLSGDKADSGVGFDFNPYFVFGGRLKSVSEYRESALKRILANTQLSFGTVNDKTFPNDLLMASGLRVTLFDTKDPLYDKTLGQEIDKILGDANSGDVTTEDFSDEESKIIELDFTPAYAASKKKYKNTAGGSMSIGAAIATRAKGQALVVDSLTSDKSQVWLSGQYDFGVSGLSMTGMLMYEKSDVIIETTHATIAGLALRQYRDNLIINAEMTYNSVLDGFEAAGLIEYYKIKNVVVYASFSYKVDEVTRMYDRIFKPGIKWNISEPK